MLNGDPLFLDDTPTVPGGAVAEQVAHDEITEKNGADHQQA